MININNLYLVIFLIFNLYPVVSFIIVINSFMSKVKYDNFVLYIAFLGVLIGVLEFITCMLCAIYLKSRCCIRRRNRQIEYV